MGRKRVENRRQILCVTVDSSTYEKVLELSDNITKSNTSRLVDKLIIEYYDEWVKAILGVNNEDKV